MEKSSIGMIKFFPLQSMACRFQQVLSCSAQPVFPSKLVANLSNHPTTGKHFSEWNLQRPEKPISHPGILKHSGMVMLLCFGFFKQDFLSYLKFSMAVNILCPLSAQDKFCFISHSYQMVLHGLTQQPEHRQDLTTALREWNPKIKICKYSIDMQICWALMTDFIVLRKQYK